jgi:hypothetical protein
MALIFVSDAPLSITPNAAEWLDSGRIDVVIQNQSDQAICVSERLEDRRRLSFRRDGRMIAFDRGPMIGWRGPDCRPLQPGETIHVLFDAGGFLPRRRSGDEICYTAAHVAPDGTLKEPKGCAVAR